MVGAEPEEAGWTQLQVFTSTRPTTRLRVDNSLIWTSLSERSAGAAIFRDLIFRTRVNWQFNRELSVRAIVQYEDTDAWAGLTFLEPRRNLNGDLLLTYRLNPWTALYVGMNVNGQNIELLTQPAGTRTLTRTDSLLRDTHQFFLKGSYLLRF